MSSPVAFTGILTKKHEFKARLANPINKILPNVFTGREIHHSPDLTRLDKCSLTQGAYRSRSGRTEPFRLGGGGKGRKQGLWGKTEGLAAGTTKSSRDKREVPPLYA
jgi:hypothetical protein